MLSKRTLSEEHGCRPRSQVSSTGSIKEVNCCRVRFLNPTLIAPRPTSSIRTRDHLSFRFLGIPYADPFERFSYSKLYSGVGNINALNYGSPCTQSNGGSEDCLFLNIYTPYLPQDPSRSKSLRPVMFWIHGGGFTSGEGSDSIYDGGNMVSRSDVVVVSINYR